MDEHGYAEICRLRAGQLGSAPHSSHLDTFGRCTPRGGPTAAEALRQHQANEDLQSLKNKEAVYESTWARPLGLAHFNTNVTATASKQLHPSDGPAAATAAAYVFRQRNAGICEPPWAQHDASRICSNKQIGNSTGHSGAEADADAIHQQYVSSHYSYAPGEQQDRHYNWGAINPERHAFGVSGEAHSPSTIRYLLGPERLAQEALQVGLGVSTPNATGSTPGTSGKSPSPNKDAWTLASSLPRGLGRPKTLSCADRSLPVGHTFGVPSRGKEPQESTADLICGPVGEQVLESDGSLLGQRFHNLSIAKPSAPAQVAGLPSRELGRLQAQKIADIPVVDVRSTGIAGQLRQDDRDDPSMWALISPSTSRCLDSAVDLARPRSAAELWALVGVPLKMHVDDFDAVLAATAGSGTGGVSVRQFLLAKSAMPTAP